MLDRESAQRPAQVNACFAGGTDRVQEIVSALHQVGLADDQITVIEQARPEKTDVHMDHPSFSDRLKNLFGGKDHAAETADHYDTIVMAHLGHDDTLAGPVQDVFQRFAAARVNYYPPAEADMHVLGGGTDPAKGTSLSTPNANTREGAGVPMTADPVAGTPHAYPGQEEPRSVESETLRHMQPGLAAGTPQAGPMPVHDPLVVDRPNEEERKPNTRE